MALVVEDGTGLATANGYISVAAVTTYATNIGDTSWAALASDTLRDAAIVRATRYMEAKWRVRWKGNKTSETQALAWPRYNVTDEDGFVVDSDAVPTAVAEACAEAAILAGDTSLDLQPDIAPPIKVARVDVLEVEYFPGSNPETVRSKVLGKIEFLLDATSTLARSA